MFAWMVATFVVSVHAQTVGQRITLPASDGVIIELSRDAASSWIPSRADIVAFEKRLPQALSSNKHVRGTRIVRELAKYKRQYYGTVTSGHRVLHITLFHASSEAVRGGRWLESFLQVMGGGDDFGHVTYDPSSRQITEAFANGPK